MFPQPYLSPTYWVTVRDPNTPTPCWQLSPEVLPCVLTHPPALLAQKCQTASWQAEAGFPRLNGLSQPNWEGA